MTQEIIENKKIMEEKLEPVQLYKISLLNASF